MNLRRFNNALTVVVILLGLYIALSPFLPQLLFWFRDDSPARVAPYAGALAEESGNTSPAPTPKDNRLVIPSISLNEPIEEAASISTLNDGGTWRRPATSKPGEVGNTVIIGHRFFASRASTFYHLDKVAVGDSIGVYWEGKEIIYTVKETKVVAANDTAIEQQTSTERLTLYTCTPLWTATNRLVIIAEPKEDIRE